MPPNNSPSNTNPAEGTSNPEIRSLTPLSYLSSPAPDLAATLLTQEEANANDENIRFLRIPHDTEESAPNAPEVHTDTAERLRHRRLARQLDQLVPRTRTDNGEQAEPQSAAERPQRDRMLRVLSRLYRFDESGRPRGSQTRQPDAQQRATDAVRNMADEVATLQGLIQDLREDNPPATSDAANVGARPRSSNDAEVDLTASHSLGRSQSNTQSSSQILRGLQRAEQEVQHLERRLQMTQQRLENTGRHADDLRSTAIMQNARTNATTTERMLRYIQQREQLGGADHEPQGAHDSSSLSRWNRLTAGTDFAETDADTPMADAGALSRNDERPLRNFWSNGYHGRRETLNQTMSRQQRMKLDHTPVSPFLENAVKYLDQIRTSTSYDDALTAAIDNGFANKEFFADKHDDFLMDVAKCKLPLTSSWLCSGVRYSGSQHTTFQSATGRDVQQPYLSATAHAMDATRSLADQSGRPIASGARAKTPLHPTERWPVRVVLHLVDYQKMTLAGTMEAYDVPNQGDSSNKGESRDRPITTFLEGQIIDMHTHSFLTPAASKDHWKAHQDSARTPSPSTSINFPKTSARVDAANWRRLPPFSNEKDDDEVARILLSHDRMAAINEQYIFMRWKERCFVHRKDDPCPVNPGVRRSSMAAQHNERSPTARIPESMARRIPPTSHSLAPSRYVTESSFSQPIPRFPRPSQHDLPFAPPPQPAAAPTSTPDLPAPPSTSPGPGPTIIAHIPPSSSPAPQRSPHTVRRRGALAHATAQYEANTRPAPPQTATSRPDAQPTGPSVTQNPGPTEEQQARSRPTRTIVLGEGDDTDTGHGLTISGFYYVSLCRETGDLTGLYWDPGTSPYQCLRLKGEGGGDRGVWSFA